MDNRTILDPFSTEDVLDVSQNITDIPEIAALYLLNLTTDGLQSSPQEASLAALWTYLAVRVLWGVLVIFGNSLTIFVVTKFERLQTCTNYLICSLAVSDLLSGLMLPLIVVHELYRTSYFSILVCQLQQTMALIALGGTMLHILYLSIDRYIYIAFPLRYHGLVTPTRLLIILTVTWINFLISVPTMVFTGSHVQVGKPCRSQVFVNEWTTTVYIVPQAFIIITSTIAFHLAIAKIAYKQSRQIQAQLHPYDTLEVAISQSTRKISGTLGLVLGVYLFCAIMPQLIMAIIAANNLSLVSFERFTIVLRWSNAWVNPLIYAWRLKDFRIAFKKIFTGTGTFHNVP